jgi:hypothetical protein
MRFPRRISHCAFASLFVGWPLHSAAQSPAQTAHWALSTMLTAYDLSRARSQTPKTAVGLSAIAGRHLGALLELRGALSVWASLPGGDPVAICEALPGGGCAPDPVVPDRLWIAELEAAVRLVPLVPLFGIGGVGGNDAGRSARRLLALPAATSALGGGSWRRTTVAWNEAAVDTGQVPWADPRSRVREATRNLVSAVAGLFDA